MTDEANDKAGEPGGSVLQFQTAEARLRAEYRRNKAAFLRLARQILRASEDEAMEMDEIRLSKGRRSASEFEDLRSRAKKGGAK